MKISYICGMSIVEKETKKRAISVKKRPKYEYIREKLVQVDKKLSRRMEELNVLQLEITFLKKKAEAYRKKISSLEEKEKFERKHNLIGGVIQFNNAREALHEEKKELEYIKHSVKGGRLEDGEERLLWCARNGYLTCVKLLLKEGVDMEYEDQLGRTALLMSAEYGRLNCVKWLAQQGADIHATDRSGSTALHFSSSWGHLDCVNYLAQQGVDIYARRDDDECTALMTSMLSGDYLDCFKSLHKKGADIDAKINDEYGCTPLMYTAANGYLDFVKYLVENGANIHAKGSKGETALDCAREKGHEEVIAYLVSKGGK